VRYANQTHIWQGHQSTVLKKVFGIKRVCMRKKRVALCRTSNAAWDKPEGIFPWSN
jgi:hypothetical protein